MAIFSPPAISSAAAAAGYDIANSARFDSASSAYLTKSVTAGDRKKWTISLWVKRGKLSSTQYLFVAGSGSLQTMVRFESDQIRFYTDNGSGSTGQLKTNAKFRDPSAWYHIVIVSDTANATAGDRMRMYVNGVEITSFATDTNPSQNVESGWNGTYTHHIGSSYTPAEYIDGHLAEFHSIEGQALTPSDFGETDGTYGHWKAKEYSGSYGTNGFYLPFEDGTSLGNDESGNNNDFTQNNISVAADQMLDSPTNNFCTLNPLDKHTSGISLTEGNLEVTSSASNYPMARGSIFASSGKWYVEVCATDILNSGYLGVGTSAATLNSASGGVGVDANGWGLRWDTNSHEAYHDGTYETAYSGTPANNDIYQIAFDVDAGKVWWGKNGTWFASGDPGAGTNAEYTNLGSEVAVMIGGGHFKNPSVTVANFGQDSSFAGAKTAQGNADDNGYGDFYYSPPTGFLALCTDNLTALSTPYQAYSSCGTEDEALEVTYTGNGNADGPFVYLGFMATEICIDGTNYSPSHADFDFNANGIKLRSATTKNTSSTSYTLEAWIDKDFKYSEAGVE